MNEYQTGKSGSEYHKIHTIFKRDPITNRIIEGDYATAELKYLANNEWEFTEKVDGTNIRITYEEGLVFKGKTDKAIIQTPLLRALQDKFIPLMPLFKEGFKNGITLYGEGYGPKIQGGEKYRLDNDFVLFDVKIGEWWLRRLDIESTAAYLGIDVVPVIGVGTLADAIKMVKEGMKSRLGDFIAEGIVAKPKVELKTRGGNRIITKIKYRDFI